MSANTLLLLSLVQLTRQAEDGLVGAQERLEQRLPGRWRSGGARVQHRVRCACSSRSRALASAPNSATYGQGFKTDFWLKRKTELETLLRA